MLTTEMYQEALDGQLRLYNYWRTASGLRIAASQMLSGFRGGFAMASPECHAQTVSDELAKAPTYYVAPGLSATILDAARSLPSFTLVPEVVFTPYGFAWFEEPLKCPTHQDSGATGVKAISWSPVDDRIAAYRRDPRGWYQQAVARGLHPLGSGVSVSLYEDVPGAVAFPAPVAEISWPYGDDWHGWGTPDASDDDEYLHKTGELQRASILTLFLWLGQKLLVDVPNDAPRATRRRVARELPTREDTTIRVVQLRRKVSPPSHLSEHEAYEWSCQWVVGGHWRQQACGPQHTERRPKWISPYVKGPEDKPLKQPSSKLYAVVR